MNLGNYKEIFKKLFKMGISSENITQTSSVISDTKPCRIPFEVFEIHLDGEVYPCCPPFIKYETSAGNIEKQSFDEIWNGDLLTDLRQRIKNLDYSRCNRDICCSYEPYTDGKIPSGYEKGPKILKISYDKECNYHCLTCRDTVKINTTEEMEKYEKNYLPKILEAAKNVEYVTLSGAGDPLYSRHSRHLIKELIKNYPEIKFKLFTNGFFLNEETLTELGIQNNIHGVSVSLDAATRETYRKILRTDAFDRVIKNLELMSEWKRQGRLWWITINFVVHSMNYKEMPDFVKLAQRLDVLAFFSAYRPWQAAKIHKSYDDIAIFEAYHKDYGKFVKILHNPVFKDEKHCSMEKRLLEIVYS